MTAGDLPIGTIGSVDQTRLGTQRSGLWAWRCFVSTVPRVLRHKGFRSSRGCRPEATPAILRDLRRSLDASGMTGTALKTCPWPGTDPLYVAYHDEEWGVPERDDRALYEKLVLDGFQAGLSWITILRKREAFRRAFDDFEPDKIARYDAKKIDALMQDSGIVRNRMKIDGAVTSARLWLEIMEKGPGFSAFLWDFVDGKPIVNRYKTDGCRPSRDGAIARHVQRAKGARLQVLRADDRLCIHAGDRHRQRPFDELSPASGLYRSLVLEGLSGGSLSRGRVDPCCAGRCALPGSSRCVF